MTVSFPTAVCEYSGFLGHDAVPVGSKLKVHLHLFTGPHDPLY